MIKEKNKRNISSLMKRKIMDRSTMEHGLGINGCHAGIPGLSLGKKMVNGSEWEWIELERAMCNMQNSQQFMCSGLGGSDHPRREKELPHEITIPVAKTLNKLFKA